MSYIIPICIKLEEFFELEYYFITDGRPERNIGNLICLQKYDLVKQDTTNIRYLTLSEWTHKIVSDYAELGASIIYYCTCRKSVYGSVPDNIIDSVNFVISHGIDEEAFLIRNRYREDLAHYKIFRSVADISTVRNGDLIHHIYKLDPNKKTVLFLDTDRTFTHILPPDDHPLMDIQNRLIDSLIFLKHTYNIIIRFHPVYFHSSCIGHNCINHRILENFIIDFTPLSMYDLYQKGDIIVSNRSTSSGYQALFLLDKNIIMIDLNLEIRKKAKFKGYFFGYEMDNSYLTQHIHKGNIIGPSHAVVGFEDKLNLIKEIEKIEKNNFIVPEWMIQNRVHFIENKFGIHKADLGPEDCTLYLKVLILCQIPSLRKDLIPIIEDSIIEEFDDSVKNKLMHIIGKFKIK